MAQAFKRPAAAKPVEDFGKEYFHAASQRYYQVLKDDEALTFRRFQRDRDGDVINEIEIPIAWVLGSANRARSYLYRTDWGEMFLLPITWYSESRQWRMSPGFEHSAHQGIQRRIKRECMFCHNAFPEVSAGSDSHWEAELFPSELPEGIGCQRCHGPGAEHIRTLLSGGSIDALRDAIVNPADLVGEQRDSVCFQCHMLPSVSIVGARRIGHGDYSFRPGQVLSDYIVHVDIAEQGIESGERFEINHHAFRFIQSPCYRESEGALSCISCHNPHAKPESTAFREKSSGVCLGCHSAPEDDHEVGIDLQGGNCIKCHMPTRRTSDVVEVTMTDHRIARGPFDLEALIEPVDMETRPVTGIGLLNFGDPPSGQRGDMYRFIAALRANRFIESAKRGLERHLQETPYVSPTPYIDLAQAQIKLGDFKGAESTSRRLIEKYKELHVAYTLLGMAMLAQGRGEEAIENLRQSLAIKPNPETHFNLAAAYLQLGDTDSAEQQLHRALELRPYMAAAWKYKGIILNSRDEIERAREAFVRSLQIEPLDASVYRELITLLRKSGEYSEAERYLELGKRVSGDPSSLEGFD
jgi:predicted CXXCH cytochrome family protein